MNVKIGVSQFFSFLRYAFDGPSRRWVITIIFLFGIFTLCNESFYELLKQSTNYLLYLALYLIFGFGFAEMVYKYFWKGHR